MSSYFQGFGEFQKYMKKFEKDLGGRSKIAALQIAAAIEREAKKNASTGKIPRDEWKTAPHIPGTGPGPNVRTGSLRDGIKYEGQPKGLFGYEVQVGSTTIYSRAVELGHPRWKSGAKYPFFWPAIQKLKADGTILRIQKSIFK
jgi:hypothetical protein